MLMTSIRTVCRERARLAVTLISFLAVAGLVLVQQQREASAEQFYQAARDQVAAEQAYARSAGLDPAELAPFQREHALIAQKTPPPSFPILNEARIGYFQVARSQELQLHSKLRSFEQRQITESRLAASDRLSQLEADLAIARRLGVDEEALAPMFPALDSAREAALRATTVRDYRRLGAELQPLAPKLATLIAEQEAINAVVSRLAAEIAAQSGGDSAVARDLLKQALSQLDTDLQTARIFQMDAAATEARRKKVLDRAPAETPVDLERTTAMLTLLGQQLQQAMARTLPEKAITISLDEQVLRAYEHGQQVWWTYITTGRPGLETDPGQFKVYWKVTPWTMHSPWDKPDPRWYPDSKVDMVMWFNGSMGMHDAPWRAYFGPGTQFDHHDPLGANTGTHGCVNLPSRNMTWLWNWTPSGTPVIVY